MTDHEYEAWQVASYLYPDVRYGRVISWTFTESYQGCYVNSPWVTVKLECLDDQNQVTLIKTIGVDYWKFLSILEKVRPGKNDSPILEN